MGLIYSPNSRPKSTIVCWDNLVVIVANEMKPHHWRFTTSTVSIPGLSRLLKI